MKRILVIEDDYVVRGNIATLLTESNYEVVQASNGLEGIKSAQIEAPDLIISDILMPDIDGYEVLEILSRNYATSSIPFIFLTAKADFNDLRKGMDLGADDYLIKPFKAGQLLKAIELRLAKHQRMKYDNKKTDEISEYDRKTKTEKTISLMLGSNPEVLKYDDIVCIVAEDVYTNVILSSGKTILFRKLLKNWEVELEEKDFIRIHRSTIINLKFIDKVEKWFNGTYKIYMKTIEIPFLISRNYSKNIKEKYNT